MPSLLNYGRIAVKFWYNEYIDFTGDKSKPADRVQPSDFKEVFSGLGYGDDDHWAGGSHSVYVPVSDDPSAVANHGGLSYAARTPRRS